MSFSQDTKERLSPQDEENRIEKGHTADDEEELVSMEGEKQSEGVKTSECKNLPYCFSLFFLQKKIRCAYPISQFLIR